MSWSCLAASVSTFLGVVGVDPMLLASRASTITVVDMRSSPFSMGGGAGDVLPS